MLFAQMGENMQTVTRLRVTKRTSLTGIHSISSCFTTIHSFLSSIAAKWRLIVRPEFMVCRLDICKAENFLLDVGEFSDLRGKPSSSTFGFMQKAILFHGLQRLNFETEDKANSWHTIPLRVGRRVRRHLKKRFAYRATVSDILI